MLNSSQHILDQYRTAQSMFSDRMQKRQYQHFGNENFAAILQKKDAERRKEHEFLKRCEGLSSDDIWLLLQEESKRVRRRDVTTSQESISSGDDEINKKHLRLKYQEAIQHIHQAQK